MPTIIGRFNELLHHLSSSSSTASVPSTVRQPTTATSSRSNPTTTSSRGSHHHQVHRHSSLSSADRQNTVRRSHSASSRTKPIVASAPTKSSRSSKAEDHHHSGSSGQRSRHRPSSSGPSLQHHSSTSSQSQRQQSQVSRRESVPKRESTTSSSHHQSRRQQLSTTTTSSSNSRRRHSIASVTSVNSANQQQLIKKPPIAASSMKNIKKTSAANSNGTNINNNKTPTTVMSTNGGDSTNSESDESLASKFARKMKLSAITRKGSGCGSSSSSSNPKITKPTENLSKKQLKANKKFAEEEAKRLELISKGCFINRYLNGQLNKKHPDIISGKTCYDLPIKDIETLESGIVSSCTGPGGGLLNVVTAPPKPFDLADDVDFIDEDYPDSSLSSSGADLSPQTPKSSASTTSSDAGATLTSSDGTGSPSSGYGVKGVSMDLKDDFHDQQPIAGICDWNRASDFAYGISTSLYESHPSTKLNAGDPIADSFAVCVRENSSIITLADGVNWGEKASLASRCAVYGCMDYLNKALYSTADSTRVKNTLDIFVALLRSFNAAHNLILAQGGHLTTLCAAVVCQLKNSNRFVVCTCNVGDSLAYVYSPLYGVREITQESHDIFSMRDMRDALGALGPVSGSEPELNNLTVAMTIVDVGDIVFLTSDGISDNFDPVVGKFAMAKKETEASAAAAVTAETQGESKQQTQGGDKSTSSNSSQKTRKAVQRSNSNPEKMTSRKLASANYTSRGLPLVSAQQRHELTLLRMEDLIMNGVNDISLSKKPSKKSAKELCTLMVDFSTKLTMAKRHILEDPELYPDDDEDGYGSEAFGKQRQRRRMVGHKLVQVPGKLDHASIAAMEVGFYGNLTAKKVAQYPQFSHLPVPFNNKTRASSHPKDYLHSDRNSANNYNNNNNYNINNNNNNNNNKIDDSRYDLKMKATLARFESQDFLECCCEAGPI